MENERPAYSYGFMPTSQSISNVLNACPTSTFGKPTEEQCQCPPHYSIKKL